MIFLRTYRYSFLHTKRNCPSRYKKYQKKGELFYSCGGLRLTYRVVTKGIKATAATLWEQYTPMLCVGVLLERFFIACKKFFYLCSYLNSSIFECACNLKKIGATHLGQPHLQRMIKTPSYLFLEFAESKCTADDNFIKSFQTLLTIRCSPLPDKLYFAYLL